MVVASAIVIGCALAVLACARLPRPLANVPSNGSGQGRTRAGRILRAVRSGASGLGSAAAWRRAVLANLAAWLLQWVGVYLVMRAVSLDLGIEAAASVLAATTVAQLLPLLPGNLVSFQAGAALPLVSVYGIGGAEALAFAVVLHATQALSALAPGVVALGMEGLGLRGPRRGEVAVNP